MIVRVQTGDTDWMLQQHLTMFVVGHEVSHWLMENVMPASERANLERITADHVAWWRRNGAVGLDEAELPRFDALWQDPSVQRSWVKELCADQMALHRTFNAFGGGWSPQIGALANVSTALFFFVLQLYEAFHTLRGGTISALTHPPAKLRRSLLIAIRAHEKD